MHEHFRRKIKQTLILLLGAVAFSVSAADSVKRLHFPTAGFSITPLETSPGDNLCQVLVMLLPGTDNFVSNVNVQIQPYRGTIEEYTALTLKQFKGAGVKLIEQRNTDKSSVVFEYSGELQGRALHWYARAEKAGGHVYLATATAAEPDWPKQSAQLKSCVESLRCESGELVPAPKVDTQHRIAKPS